ncbi:hypothetical protein EVAR_57867_1 [Eumeta japonica]|uniref:Uncharacterized protein n=1 Tax=Eumeta variegata TaxID=151549 RepID=A0A4C1ZG94_EUMVA|nr:hypothetical protein EVAR_57867_1 [Eumeta japonica]
MFSPSASKGSQKSTLRASSCSLPHHMLHALMSPPRIILSVPSFEQIYRTRSKYGSMGISPWKYTDTTPILQFPAFITLRVKFSTIRVWSSSTCAPLSRIMMAAFTGLLHGVTFWTTRHPVYRRSSPLFPT